MLLGDKCKSDYRRSFFGKGFNKEHLDLLGVQHSVKEIRLDKIIVEHQIWEVSDNLKFQTIRKRFFQGVFSAIVVVDVLDDEKLDELKFWFEELSQISQKTLHLIIIINDGNCDNNKCRSEINIFSADLLAQFDLTISSANCYCSTLDSGKNIDISFLEISNQLVATLSI
ncbi:MAG: hypothetical protein ACW99Q_23885 [Candidatus Kariarchaeaceae archaeon]